MEDQISSSSVIGTLNRFLSLLIETLRDAYLPFRSSSARIVRHDEDLPHSCSASLATGAITNESQSDGSTSPMA